MLDQDGPRARWFDDPGPQGFGDWLFLGLIFAITLAWAAVLICMAIHLPGWLFG